MGAEPSPAGATCGLGEVAVIRHNAGLMAPQQNDSNTLTAARSLEDRVWRSLRNKDLKQALAACEQLNREHPDYASGWHTASQLALRLEKPAAALAAIDRALAIEPGNTDGLLQRGLCLGRLGDTAALEPLVADLESTQLAAEQKLPKRLSKPVRRSSEKRLIIAAASRSPKVMPPKPSVIARGCRVLSQIEMVSIIP